MKKNIDLLPLVKKLEIIVNDFFNSKETIGLALAMTFPPDYKSVSWVTNFSREDGALLFLTTAEKMIKDYNIKKNQKPDMN